MARPPKVTDPLGMILLENAAYLVSDDRREQVFNSLRQRVGLTPPEILRAHEAALLEVARLGGMPPAARVEKLRRIAQIALQEFDGDLDKVLKLPLPFQTLEHIDEPRKEAIPQPHPSECFLASLCLTCKGPPVPATATRNEAAELELGSLSGTFDSD